jgi:hypothetical protein
MAPTAGLKIGEKQRLDDQTKDKEAVFRLLSKFNLSLGDVAEIFAAYLLDHPALFESSETRRALISRRKIRNCYENAELLTRLFLEGVRTV